MSNTFNINRFGKYFLYDLKKQTKDIGPIVLSFGLLPILLYIIGRFFSALNYGGIGMMFSDEVSGPSGGARLAEFMLVTIIFLFFFPSKAYGKLTEKNEGSSWLMLPASRLEKFISMLLMTMVIIPLAYYVIYFFCDGMICLLDHSCGGSILLNKGGDSIMSINSDDFAINGFWIIVGGTIETTIAYLLGALVFKKWKIIGTIVAWFIIETVLVAIFGTLFSTMDGAAITDRINEWIMSSFSNIDLVINVIVNVFLILVVAACGTGIWFRIKKMQH